MKIISKLCNGFHLGVVSATEFITTVLVGVLVVIHAVLVFDLMKIPRWIWSKIHKEPVQQELPLETWRAYILGGEHLTWQSITSHRETITNSTTPQITATITMPSVTIMGNTDAHSLWPTVSGNISTSGNLVFIDHPTVTTMFPEAIEWTETYPFHGIDLTMYDTTKTIPPQEPEPREDWLEEYGEPNE